MSATKYEVYCKCINSVSNIAITNTDSKQWVSCFDCKGTTKYDNKNAYVKETLIFNNKGNDDENKKCNDALIESLKSFQNEKYNMLFIYAGQEIYYEGSSGSIPYVVIDRFQRIFASPWFVHSTHASLNSAMTKAEALVKKIGHDNIKIGKIVDLEQYIDIV